MPGMTNTAAPANPIQDVAGLALLRVLVILPPSQRGLFGRLSQSFTAAVLTEG
jgi:hypothetical protein